MREAIQKLEEIELDLFEVYRDMISLKNARGAEKVRELKDDLYGLMIELEDEL